MLLDELDKVYIAQNSKFVPKTLEEFIRRMISKGSAFIICTNLKEQDLLNTFGESTMSMFRGHLQFLNFLGDDYRKNQNTEWLSRLDQDIDYFDPVIVDDATRMGRREIKEEADAWRV